MDEFERFLDQRVDSLLREMKEQERVQVEMDRERRKMMRKKQREVR